MATYQDHRRHYLGENDRIDHIAEALERPCSVVITPRVIPDGHAPALSPIQEGTSDTSACFSNGSPVCRRASFSHARGNEDAKAQPPLRRTLRKLKGFFSAMLCQRGMEPTTRDIRGPPACRQYRIAPFEERGNWWHGLTFCTESGLVNHSLWHYRTTFMRSLMVFLLQYFFLVIFFAILISQGVIFYYQYGAQENCLTGWNYDDPLYRENFPLAMELSWTTLSTVGFGVVAVPSTSGCQAVRYMLAVEAFIGVLFIGYTGALLMAKISRQNATARVVFSSAVCLQYGAGLTDTRFDVVRSLRTVGGLQSLDNSDEESLPEAISQDYPFIEFRIVNERSNRKGGEIAECSVRCMTVGVKLVEKDNYPSQISLMEDLEESQQQIDDAELNHSAIEGETNMGLDSNGAISPHNIKRAYTRVTVKPDFHPYFAKGGWYLRHILDHESPFLKPKVRAALKTLNGWPTRLNDHEAIRRCLATDIFEFSLIFQGKSNLTSDMVFKIHTYKTADIYIGFKFADLGYVVRSDEDRQGEVQFDLSLVHDIVPQDGGGNEPLGSRVAEENVLKFLKDGFLRSNKSKDILPTHSRDSSDGIQSTTTVMGSMVRRRP